MLPWVLAMVAIPLEMLLDSGRHVLASLGVFALNALATLSRAVGHVFGYVTRLLASLYDVYIAVPLRIEGMVRGRDDNDGDDKPARPRSRRAPITGESLA